MSCAITGVGFLGVDIRARGKRYPSRPLFAAPLLLPKTGESTTPDLPGDVSRILDP